MKYFSCSGCKQELKDGCIDRPYSYYLCNGCSKNWHNGGFKYVPSLDQQESRFHSIIWALVVCVCVISVTIVKIWGK
jgi:hypothetical protein